MSVSPNPVPSRRSINNSAEAATAKLANANKEVARWTFHIDFASKLKVLGEKKAQAPRMAEQFAASGGFS